MRVTANGKPIELRDGASVVDLLAELGFTPRVVVVERNGEPVPRAEMEHIRLGEGDVLEIVRPVQGG